MDELPESLPPPTNGAVSGKVPGARRMLPRWPVMIGIIGLGAVVTTGTLVKRRTDARQHAESQGIRMEVSSLRAEVEQYRERFGSLRWNAEKIRAAADAARVEPEKSWLRERSRRFDALVAGIDRSTQENEFARLSSEIESACARGDIDAARARLMRLPQVSFPSPTKFLELQAELFSKPLAELSRQNPAYYDAFRRYEPEAAKEDVAALRRELNASGMDAVTPQLIMKLELFSAVAPPGDPLLDELAALMTAPDHFENPDAATLAAWRNAQRAIRAEDWPTVAAQMQSILRSTVRTRQPFRAAYGRAILRNSPNDVAAAYPFMEEAAGAGDAAARAWIVEEELKQGRRAQALRWLEVAAMAGEKESVPKLIELYMLPRATLSRDVGREAGVLQRITTAPDAPPLASMLLARLYEEGSGVPASPVDAFRCYKVAADQQHVPAWPELARRYLRGDGTAENLDQACDWACRAFAAGEHEKVIPILLELMSKAPERTATAVQEMFEHEQVAGRAGFDDTRIGGPSMAQLRMQMARHFDQKGDYGRAAKLYEKSGSRDPSVMRRMGELTTVRPCETCSGAGKVKHTSPCPICDSKGTVLCPVCDSRGYSFAPGSPPCGTCAGSGKVNQDGRVYACSTCGGSGKGKSSVIKQPCPNCSQGRTACRECTGGRIVVMRECSDCRGTGSRALADK